MIQEEGTKTPMTQDEPLEKEYDEYEHIENDFRINDNNVGDLDAEKEYDEYEHAVQRGCPSGASSWCLGLATTSTFQFFRNNPKCCTVHWKLNLEFVWHPMFHIIWQKRNGDILKPFFHLSNEMTSIRMAGLRT
jgi:hypothetical protein